MKNDRKKIEDQKVSNNRINDKVIEKIFQIQIF